MAKVPSDKPSEILRAYLQNTTGGKQAHRFAKELLIGPRHRLIRFNNGSSEPITEVQADSLTKEIQALQQWIRSNIATSLTPEVENNPLLKKILGNPHFPDEEGNLPPLISATDWENFATTRRNLAIHQARQILNRTPSDAIPDTIIHHLEILIDQLLYRQTKSATKKDTIVANPKAQGRHRIRFSVYTLKKAFAQIAKNDALKDDNDLILALLENLGAIDQNDISTRKDYILTEIAKALGQATGEFKEIALAAEKEMKKQLDNGKLVLAEGQDLTYPTVGPKAMIRSAFSMLRTVLNGMQKTTIGKSEMRDLTDMQPILYIAYLIFCWNISAIGTKAETERTTTMNTIFSKLEEYETEKGTYQEYIYNNGEFETNGRNPTINLYKIPLSEGKNIRIGIDWVNVKESDSVWRNLILKMPNADQTDVQDVLRGRIISFDHTIKDFQNPEKHPELIELCQKAMEPMGLKYKQNAEKTKLEDNEYTIEIPEVGNNFTKFTIHFIHNGVKSELQLIPKKIFEAEEAGTKDGSESPLSHEKYKESQTPRFMLLSQPGSGNALFYQAMINWQDRLKEESKAGKAALKNLAEQEANQSLAA